MSDIGKRPAFQWYPGDWRRDTGLQSCSLAARGLWVEMLCVMHDGEPYGTLRIGAKIITPATLARMIGESPNRVEKLLQELEDASVFSRDSDGAIYSRRMVRDERVRVARAAGGKLSLDNPAVPKPKYKDGPKDHGKDHAKDILPTVLPPENGPSFGGSPAFALCSTATASASTEEQSGSSSGPLSRIEPEISKPKRGKAPIFVGERIVVHGWMVDELHRMLGGHTDSFDLQQWFPRADELALAETAVLPNCWPWLKAKTLDEAKHRGLPVAVPEILPAQRIGKQSSRLPSAVANLSNSREPAPRELQHPWDCTHEPRCPHRAACAIVEARSA